MIALRPEREKQNYTILRFLYYAESSISLGDAL